MLLEIFKDSFEYSYKDTDSIFKLGILSLLSMMFTFPIFFVAGYYYRVIDIGLNGTINGDDPLPKFENWFEMFIQGFKILLIRFIYFIPGILIFFPATTILWLHYALQYTVTPMPESLVFSILPFQIGILSLSVILCLVFYLFSTVAVTNMINNNGSLSAAFNFKEMIKIIGSIGVVRYVKLYFGGIILGIGIFGAALLGISLISFSMTFIIWIITNSYTYSAIVGGPIIGVLSIIVILSLIPFFLIFESRAIALIYNMREVD